MKPEKDCVLYETPISTHWFNENGFFCVLSKNVDRTLENYQKVMDVYKNAMTGNEKLCVLSDVTVGFRPMAKEVRLFVASELPKYIKALAIISEVKLNGTHVNTFLKLTFSGLPIQLFSNENDAKEWLKDYL
ncbi:MAG: STAS/SEC14 domain-containing protein [Bacteroidota bacterium]